MEEEGCDAEVVEKDVSDGLLPWTAVVVELKSSYGDMQQQCDHTMVSRLQ